MTEIERLLHQQLTSLQLEHQREINELQKRLDSLCVKQQQQQKCLSILSTNIDQHNTHSEELRTSVEKHTEAYGSLKDTVVQLFSECELLSNKALEEARQALRSVAVNSQEADHAFSQLESGLKKLQNSVNGLIERQLR